VRAAYLLGMPGPSQGHAGQALVLVWKPLGVEAAASSSATACYMAVVLAWKPLDSITWLQVHVSLRCQACKLRNGVVSLNSCGGGCYVMSCRPAKACKPAFI